MSLYTTLYKQVLNMLQLTNEVLDHPAVEVRMAVNSILSRSITIEPRGMPGDVEELRSALVEMNEHYMMILRCLNARFQPDVHART